MTSLDFFFFLDCFVFCSISRWTITGSFRDLFPDFYGVTCLPWKEKVRKAVSVFTVYFFSHPTPSHRLDSQYQCDADIPIVRRPSCVRCWTNDSLTEPFFIHENKQFPSCVCQAVFSRWNVSYVYESVLWFIEILYNPSHMKVEPFTIY